MGYALPLVRGQQGSPSPACADALRPCGAAAACCAAAVPAVAGAGASTVAGEMRAPNCNGGDEVVRKGWAVQEATLNSSCGHAQLQRSVNLWSVTQRSVTWHMDLPLPPAARCPRSQP